MLVDLGAAVLSAVLLGTPLPDLGRPLQLADIALAVDEDRRVRLLDDGFAERVAERLAPALEVGAGTRDWIGLRLVSTEALGSETRALVGALRLHVTPIGDDARVTIETCVRRDQSDDIVTIEALNVVFTEQDGTWVVAEPPSHLAT